MEAFMKKMFAKKLLAIETWGKIKEDSRLHKYIFEPQPPEGQCFHIKLKEPLDSDNTSEKITSVSVSYPMDVYSEEVVEIALLNEKNSVTGVEHLGIDDVAQIPKDNLVDCLVSLSNNQPIPTY